MFHYTSSRFMSIVYLIVANIVVGYTLRLREDRANKAGTTVSGIIASESPAALALMSDGLSSEATLTEPDSVPARRSSAQDHASSSSICPDLSPNLNKPGEKPLAGSTFPFVEGISPNVPPHTWSRCDHRKFVTRIGPNYDRWFNSHKALISSSKKIICSMIFPSFIRFFYFSCSLFLASN